MPQSDSESVAETIAGELLDRMKAAETDAAMSQAWADEWHKLPPEQRTAAAMELVTHALRVAYGLVETANAANVYALAARTVRLDASAQALCMLAAVALSIARDADDEDHTVLRGEEP